MNATSTRQRRLTRNALGDDSPEWSPDGSRIAFVRDAYGMGEIYVMNADGTKKRRLTRNRAFDTAPVWSPDGRRIAFRSDRDGQTAIYTMNADGKDQTKLTRSTTPQGGPTWSPDGSRIAFVAFKQPLGTGGPTEIRVVDVDGTDERRLTHAGTQDMEPAWSPDGRQIVFTRGFLRFSRSDQRYELIRSEIWRVNADGTERAPTDTNAKGGRRTSFQRGRPMDGTLRSSVTAPGAATSTSWIAMVEHCGGSREPAARIGGPPGLRTGRESPSSVTERGTTRSS